MEEQIYLLQYPNRPRNRPYSNRNGATPKTMRIKPRSGYLEVDVKLNTSHNFNKYMGLKWGDASRVSKDLHNRSGTYGLAAGLTAARPRAMTKDTNTLKDPFDRELELENNLADFNELEKEGKVFSTQTLGGQIIRHDERHEQGKPIYLVGAFEGNQLHLTKVTGTVQVRPQFHHLDAEEERCRVAVSRAAQAESGDTGPAPIARSVQPRFISEEEKVSLEARMKSLLHAAEAEPWINMDYVDEDDDEAYKVFHEKLFVNEVDKAPVLVSSMDNDSYLDAISAPRNEVPTRRRRRPPRRKEMVDLDGEDGEGGEGNKT